MTNTRSDSSPTIGAGGQGPSALAPVWSDVAAVLRDARLRFMDGFTRQCDSLDPPASLAAISPPAAEAALKVVHQMAGLAGTIGFPLVSRRASALEDALRIAVPSPIELREGVAALRAAFDDDLATACGDNEPAAPMPAGSPMRVLVVEDDPVQRAILCGQLRSVGHAPTEVTTGEEVMAAARTHRPEVILLDLDLPGISGVDVCRLLKSDPALAEIPIALLSARTGLDDRLTGLTLGAADFLTKPIDFRELALRLQLLRKTAGGRADGLDHGVLSYDQFSEPARVEIGRGRCALTLIRVRADQLTALAMFVRDEIRRRDLCCEFDRERVAVLLLDVAGATARERMTRLVEGCRAQGMIGVFAGVAGFEVAGSRTLEQLVEEADEALAIARYENLAAAQRPEVPRVEATPGLMPLVLVGEDDPDVVRIVDAHLAAAGYRRVLTFDGRRALEEARAQRPDVLILDLMMPRMTGFEVLAGLRDMEGHRPRVLVLSARGREEDVVRAFSLGADDFMLKPFNPQELVARVARFTKRPGPTA